METFEQAWKRLTGDISLRKVAELAAVDPGHLSRIVRGQRPATREVARALDKALRTGGQFVAVLGEDRWGKGERPAPVRSLETAELVRKLQMNAVDAATIEALHGAVFELCCDYPKSDAAELRIQAHECLREVTRLVHLPIGLTAHRELLTAGGWLALLAGCLEYDMGLRAGAEATRIAARELGRDGGNNEIVAWSYEMEAWFALTQSRWRDVQAAVDAGQYAAPSSSAAIQLAGQSAKANARLGNGDGVRKALDWGGKMLAAKPPPIRPDHHFVVDPDKWDFYAMDAFRAAGDDDRAVYHAKNVIALSSSPEGERSPMRAAEARLTLATAASRRGDLEEAVADGISALNGPRKSLPSLLMVGAELDEDLHLRFPREAAPGEFREALRAVQLG